MITKFRASNKHDIEMDKLRSESVDYDTTDQKNRVLSWLAKIPASYLSEIAWESGLSEYQVKLLLNILRSEGLIEQVIVSYDAPDVRLMLRVPDQSQQGQAGYASFSRKKWFAITLEGRDFLVSNL